MLVFVLRKHFICCGWVTMEKLSHFAKNFGKLGRRTWKQLPASQDFFIEILGKVFTY